MGIPECFKGVRGGDGGVGGRNIVDRLRKVHF